MTGPDTTWPPSGCRSTPAPWPQRNASPDPAETAQRIQRRMADLAEAQVHATLALAAVLGISAGIGGVDMMAWREVAATRP